MGKQEEHRGLGYEIVDAFPAFVAFWDAIQRKPLEAQVEAWASDYASQWPELLQKQVEDYANQGVDWRQVGRERVFPFLGERFLAMKEAHENLLAACRPIYAATRAMLGFDADVVFVIHVGIGCGAGWATEFDGLPAVLFGLENVAECGWSGREALDGLIAHELGHLAHFRWRAEGRKEMGSGPWWQLYEEGFAQRCEHLTLGRHTWHMVAGEGDGWLDWCREQQGWLAAEFLRLADAGEPVHPFFGSWFEIRGRKQCGYFLGHQVVRELEADADLKQIALLEDYEPRLRSILERLAQDDEKVITSRSPSS
jgi:hypothetical protein